MELLRDGSMILNGFGRTPETAAFWLHQWDPTQGREGFRWSEMPWDQGENFAIYIAFDGSDDGSVWATRQFERFELHRISPEGVRLQSIVPRRPWFDDYAIPVELGSDDPRLVAPPQSRIRDVRTDAGLVWVLGTTRDLEWADFRSEGFADFGRYLDNVIDIYDEETGDLLLSQRFDIPNTVLSGFMDDGRLIGLETQSSHNLLTLWEVELNSITRTEMGAVPATGE